MKRPQIGTRFEFDDQRPWRAPCASCGRGTPTHYANVAGRKKLVRCPAHQIREGIERATVVCRVTVVEGDSFSYVVEEQKNLRDTPPFFPQGQRIESGGANVSWFDQQLARGAFRLLLHADYLPEGNPTRNEEEPSDLFIYAEDLVSALVGPFDSKEEAEEHIRFCEARGDADPGRVVTQDEAKHLDPAYTITPDDDRKESR